MRSDFRNFRALHLISRVGVPGPTRTLILITITEQCIRNSCIPYAVDLTSVIKPQFRFPILPALATYVDMFLNALDWIQHQFSQFATIARAYGLSASSAIILSCIALYLFYTLIYGLFLCPLRHLPGPFITRFTSIPYYILVFSGKGGEQTAALHKKYGIPNITYS
jgi:hypothetical protein